MFFLQIKLFSQYFSQEKMAKSFQSRNCEALPLRSPLQRTEAFKTVHVKAPIFLSCKCHLLAKGFTFSYRKLFKSQIHPLEEDMLCEYSELSSISQTFLHFFFLLFASTILKVPY